MSNPPTAGSASRPTVQDLCNAMESIAPLSGAEPWDKVGLHVGDPSAVVDGPVLLTIDLTEAVMDEALRVGAGAIIAYHPPIWKPLDRVTMENPAQRNIRRAIAAGIAIYSPHTAIDAAEDGLTDWLAAGIAGDTRDGGQPAADVRALQSHPVYRKTQELKIVTFVPASHVEHLRNALATSGAGRIGDYEVCSFSMEGTGTFLGGPGTHPTIGEAGTLQHAEEVRLEMVCSESGLALAVETLRQFHPYEEPAIDIYALRAEPRRGVGLGRRLVLDRPATVEEVGRRLREHLRPARIKIASPEPEGGLGRQVSKIAVVAGSGSDLVDLAIAEGAQVFVTGEMKHHEILAALSQGLTLILAGHTNTERGYLPRLAERVSGLDGRFKCVISEADRDPLVVLS